MVLLFGVILAKYETVSVKVSPEMKDKIRKYGIKTSDVLRDALEKEIRRKEIEEIEAELESIKDVLEKISIEDVVKSIRGDRDTR